MFILKFANKKIKQKNNNKINRTTNYNLSNNDYSWYYLIPLLIVAFIPLIVYMRPVPIHPEAAPFWVSDDFNVDFFSYLKARWLLWMTGFAIISIILLYIQNKINLTRLSNKLIFIPLSIYAVLTILSSLSSKYKYTAIWGFPDRYEGMLVLLAYILVMLATALLTQSDRHLKALLVAIAGSTTIISLIGIFQFFGADYFRTEFGKRMMLPAIHSHMADTLEFNFGAHTIYSTLYNTNYVGSFMTMLLPISIAMLLYLKQPKHKLLAGVFSCLIFANWVGSNSRAGLVGGVIGIVLLLILLRKVIIANWKQLAALLVSFVLIFSIMNIVSEGRLTGKYSSLNKQLDIGKVTDTDPPRLEDIVIDGNNASIITHRHTLNILVNDGVLSFTDTNGIDIMPDMITEDREIDDQAAMEMAAQGAEISVDDAGTMTISEEYMVLTNPEYDAYKFQFVANALRVKLGSYEFFLGIVDEEFKLFNNSGQILTIEPIPTWGFEGRELMGSSRGYIWSRSIPMLKDAIILGQGPDTYPITYPQHDYMGKLKYLYSVDMVVDKPHNLYLQIALGTGVLSLIALLVFWGWYFFYGLFIYIKHGPNSITDYSGVSILAGITGYLIAGLFNDSLVSVAPMFWLLLGIGLACNYMTKEQLNKVNNSM